MKRQLAFAATVLALLPFDPRTATAQSAARPLDVDMIMRGPALVGYQPQGVRWSPDGKQVFFEWKQAVDAFDKDFDTWVVNRDGSGLRRFTDEEKKRAVPRNGEKSRDRQRVLFTEAGDVYLFEAAGGGRRIALTRTSESESSPRFTRDEKRVTYTRGNNLYAIDLASGSIEQLTNIVGADEKGPFAEAWNRKKGTESQEFIRQEERKLLATVDRRARKREETEAKRKLAFPLEPYRLEGKQEVSAIELTPDGRHVIVTLTTPGDRAKKPLVPNYVTETAYTETIPAREKVGDSSEASKIVILDARTGESKPLDLGLKVAAVASVAKIDLDKSKTVEMSAATGSTPPPVKDGAEARQQTEKNATQTETAAAKDRDISVGGLAWSEDGSRAVVAVRSIDNKDRWIMAIDPLTGKSRVLASMHDDAWVNYLGEDTFGFVADNKTVYYLSEQSGYMHLYTVSFDGGPSRAVTSGKWEVTNVELSNDRKRFHLTTSEESPFERHLYVANTSGGDRRKITTGVGNHSALLSPDESAVAEVFSYTNRPPELFVGSAGNSRNSVKVTSSPAADFSTRAWLDVPIVRIPARDGASVPARIYKPQNWKSGGPAVVFVHGAGYLQNVHRWWSNYYREYMFHHLLMERGYLVLDIDYRASSGYGRDWRTGIYRHMGGKDLDDHVDAAKWMVKEHGVDAKRIGIYGGSYGGFITLMAMFTQPDVFAAGAALRPVTDWAHYNQGYTSNILNSPQSDPEAYRRSSPIHFAEGLKGPLLILHGMVDVNVHFQDSVRLAQKLIELRKENWELAAYPAEDHAFVEPASWADEYKRILKLFETNLK